MHTRGREREREREREGMCVYSINTYANIYMVYNGIDAKLITMSVVQENISSRSSSNCEAND